jgi:hypothetical protein
MALNTQHRFDAARAIVGREESIRSVAPLAQLAAIFNNLAIIVPAPSRFVLMRNCAFLEFTTRFHAAGEFKHDRRADGLDSSFLDFDLLRLKIPTPSKTK